MTQQLAADGSAALAAELEKMKAELARYQERERIEKENHELKERYKREPRATSTRNTLVLRRTPNHDMIAPVRDVLDYLTLYDMSDPAKAKAEGKKIHVSDEVIRTFQKLKIDGVQNITLEMVKQAVVASGGRVDAPTDADNIEG